jgi:RES domain-containing protein
MPTKLAIEVLPALRLFRIASQRYKVFDGTGAAIVGGRWNQLGLASIYTSTSLAGAKLELLAHIGFNGLPRNYAFVEVEVPEDAEVEIYRGKKPPALVKSIAWGSHWFRSATTLLARVPSEAAPAEFNFIINPHHSDFAGLVVSKEQPAKWDARHFK